MIEILTDTILSVEDKILLLSLKEFRDSRQDDTIPYNDLEFFMGLPVDILKEKIREFSRMKIIMLNKEETRWKLDLSGFKERWDNRVELYKKCNSNFFYNEVREKKEVEMLNKKVKSMEKNMNKLEGEMTPDNLFTYFRVKYKEEKRSEYSLETRGKDIRLIKMLHKTYGNKVKEMIDKIFKDEQRLRLRTITVGALWGFRESLI